MKLLFIGDIVGEPGRRAVSALLPRLRERHLLDFVVANCENAAGGNGITAVLARELFEAGIDILTTGDHVWDQKEVINLRFLLDKSVADTARLMERSEDAVKNLQRRALAAMQRALAGSGYTGGGG